MANCRLIKKKPPPLSEGLNYFNVAVCATLLGASADFCSGPPSKHTTLIVVSYFNANYTKVNHFLPHFFPQYTAVSNTRIFRISPFGIFCGCSLIEVMGTKAGCFIGEKARSFLRA